MKILKFITLCLFFTLNNSLVYGKSNLTVRFWEGQKSSETKIEDHLAFIRDSLAPGTVVAGLGALEHYVVYLPPAKKLPSDSYLNELPFSEAAIPTYTNQNVYTAARNLHKEYGPLHFLKNGFQKGKSYSSTPVVFDENSGVKISSSSERIAYDLRDYSSVPPEATFGGEEKYPDPNWQNGTTVVWLQLRKNGTSEEQYLKSINDLFSLFKEGVSIIDGHYARVDEGHVLHFLNVLKKEDVKKLSELLVNISAEKPYKDTLLNFDVVTARSLRPFETGWAEAFESGKAINVQFLRPGSKLNPPKDNE